VQGLVDISVAFRSAKGAVSPGAKSDSIIEPGDRYVLKTIYEHASFALDDDSIISAADAQSLRGRVVQRARSLGRPCFAERYVEGREFNLSLLAGEDGAEVLPPAEIDFSAFPEGKPQIVGRRAKWEEQSFEFQQTPRCFEYPPSDASLLARLQDLAARCWALFRLRGYARVDFRVDRRGWPWILEINANPCLSPDAGFAAALEYRAIPFAEAIRRILADA
jgi:D-alanine-D-alanine ligase